MLRPVFAILISYLIGSIPFGYILVRATTGTDVRETGSGGTGATNVSRRAGKIAGVVTLVLDALKGSLAVLFASWLLRSSSQPSSTFSWWLATAGFIAVLAHIFPVWLGFRGGKGVATAAGVFAVLAPGALACAGLIFVVVVAITRYVSLGSILSAISVPLFIWLGAMFITAQLNAGPIITAALATALLIVFAHRGNLKRLAAGNENKI